MDDDRSAKNGERAKQRNIWIRIDGRDLVPPRKTSELSTEVANLKLVAGRARVCHTSWVPVASSVPPVTLGRGAEILRTHGVLVNMVPVRHSTQTPQIDSDFSRVVRRALIETNATRDAVLIEDAHSFQWLVAS